MTRRNIIIIAVLVNAGLLAILFMMAVTSEDETTPLESKTEVVSIGDDLVEKPTPVLTLSKTPTDEVDQAIQALNDPSTPQPIIIDDEALDLEQDTEELEVEEPKKEEPKKSALTQAEPQIQENSTTVEKPSVKESKKVEVTVKKGDSLDKIARANGTTIKALKEANKLKNDKLKVGQVLQVPVSNEKKSVAKEKQPASKKETEISDADPQYYTIKNGDNPWKVAKKFHIKVEDFLKLNNMSEEKARNLKVGEKVRVK